MLQCGTGGHPRLIQVRSSRFSRGTRPMNGIMAVAITARELGLVMQSKSSAGLRIAVRTSYSGAVRLQGTKKS